MNKMPPDETGLKESLAKTGRRMTRQRQEVHDAVQRYKNHPTADEVFAWVRKDIPDIGLATVYKALEALVESGYLAKIPRSDDAPARYDHQTNPHQHMRCVDCGKIWNIGKDAPSISPTFFNLDDKIKAVGYTVEVRVKCPVECPLCPRKHAKIQQN